MQRAIEALPPGSYSARESGWVNGWVMSRTSMCGLAPPVVFSAPDAKAIEAVLCALQGCVVTKAEHQLPKPFDATHEGWARYIAAGVPVIERRLVSRLIFQLWNPIDGRLAELAAPQLVRGSDVDIAPSTGVAASFGR
jgi:hypothetical protein